MRVSPIILRRALIGVLALGTTVVVAGCQKPLFAKDKPRSQFEMHDRMRNRYKPKELEDEFGRLQPALRERLGKTGLTS